MPFGVTERGVACGPMAVVLLSEASEEVRDEGQHHLGSLELGQLLQQSERNVRAAVAVQQHEERLTEMPACAKSVEESGVAGSCVELALHAGADLSWCLLARE